jgi:N-acetylglutamate synthase-like GNAT family acetyltransferase
MMIRLCRDDERDVILAIINAGAEAYRGVIPADRWHEPYMPGHEFDRECLAGVVFWGYEDRGRLAGVMGLQDVCEVNLIRHAYVAPAKQRDGVGGKLLTHLLGMSTKPMLVGTWAAATWAIRFYQRHGFALVSPQRKTELLKSYWTIPERQIETSVVLANPPDRDYRESSDLLRPTRGIPRACRSQHKQAGWPKRDVKEPRAQKKRSQGE